METTKVSKMKKAIIIVIALAIFFGAVYAIQLKRQKDAMEQIQQHYDSIKSMNL